MAARVRDLAVLALGAAASPRLNFDADEYSLSEVELLLASLVEEQPQHFSQKVGGSVWGGVGDESQGWNC
jgi:hypothetical protein